jgi:hypothetical protein
MVVAGNFQSTATISVSPGFQHTGVWYELLTGEELDVSDINASLSLQPGVVRIYTDRNTTGLPSFTTDNAVYISVSEGIVRVVSPENLTALSVYNLQGMLLKTVANTNTINVSDLASGVYLVAIQMPDMRIVKKIVVQN